MFNLYIIVISKEFTMTLTKRGLALKLAKNNGLTQQKSIDTVQGIIDIISDELLNGNRIELRTFGVFELSTRKQRIGRNPNSPEDDIIIPERTVVKFRAGLNFKDKIQNRKVK
jgi:nucleoid DNA-binding protein